ncbi:Voltage-dependent L-type calcium channel subunit beta-1 [Larimichthys crocea]|uniref:Uncharacterized protein n=1 Tax=Larimichthys crocea TaxID=215358 RepID=A0ACD3R7L1_LARCR|nr:Voltage-dependent L-type calcium channel subunit beta-1 [Larimichthys crocea]
MSRTPSTSTQEIQMDMFDHHPHTQGKYAKRKSRFKRSDGSTSSDTTSNSFVRQEYLPLFTCVFVTDGPLTVLYLTRSNGFDIISGNNSKTPVTTATSSFIVTEMELKDISRDYSGGLIVIISPQLCRCTDLLSVVQLYFPAGQERVKKPLSVRREHFFSSQSLGVGVKASHTRDLCSSPVWT